MPTDTTERLYQHLVAESVLDEAAGCRVVQKYIKWIAKALRVSARTIQRHLRQLEALGWIRVEEDFFDHGGHKANRYLLVKERALGKPDLRDGLEERSPREPRPDLQKATDPDRTGGEQASGAPTQKTASPQVKRAQGRTPTPPSKVVTSSISPDPPNTTPPQEAPWVRAFLERLEGSFPHQLLKRTMPFSEARLYLSWWFEERWGEVGEEEAEELYRWLASRGGWRKLKEWFLLLEKRSRREIE